MKVFVDANIPMYAAGRPHPHREPAIHFLARVGHGELPAFTSTEVLQEILYRYSSIERLDLANAVYAAFVDSRAEVLPIELRDTDRARDLLCSIPGISSRDAIHAAVMLNYQIEWIATFDRGFDRIPGIRRLPLP